MYKIVLVFFAVIWSVNSYASVDIELACDEKKEQKYSLLTKFSTSIKEANLAGQCIGYESYYEIDISQACSEFIEQKASLLTFLSTSIKEANLAGMCIGAIYRIAKKCNRHGTVIDYSLIAKRILSIKPIEMTSNCSSEKYGW